MSQAKPRTWTTRALLAWMAGAFEKKGLDSPRLCAELLVSHVLGCERLKLYMDPDRPATPIERQTLRDLTTRALEHEPVQYLVGEAWFFGMPFKVDRRALIPRPATETIVEHVLQHARAQHADLASADDLVIDMCTGSGCVTIAIAKNMPGARVVATDISAEALELAQANATRHNVSDRIDFEQGDLFDAIDAHAAARAHASAAYLVSNPPYIPDDEWAEVPPNVKDHEPELALRGGNDGLDLVRTIFNRGPQHLQQGGLVLVEIAETKADEARALAEANELLTDVKVLDDFEGRPRVVRARRA
ncbi:MAG: peptide chain release factor N(5)-glutamine methyltransferase [Planctomycetota bacterium]